MFSILVRITSLCRSVDLRILLAVCANTASKNLRLQSPSVASFAAPTCYDDDDFRARSHSESATNPIGRYPASFLIDATRLTNAFICLA
jgi:hypothetical protein